MDSTPLLSISIPTYNRAHCLDRLLSTLFEQVVNDSRVEIIVSDNASVDETQVVVERYVTAGMRIRYIRNTANVGGDENIRRCYEYARAKYVWVFGDDDVVAPSAVKRLVSLLQAEDLDLLFLAPYHFAGEGDQFLPKKRLKPDVFKVTDDPRRLVNLVDTHSDFMFITAVIINKEIASAAIKADLSSLVVDNIVQLGWILPVLRNLRRGAFIDAQLVGQATLNAAGGFDAAAYYGRRFKNALDVSLDGPSELAERLTDNHLTMWAFCWLEWRWHNISKEEISVIDPHRNLVAVYGRNFRYWLCVYPLLILPEPLAKIWAFPLLVRRKLLRLWYQAITPTLDVRHNQ